MNKFIIFLVLIILLAGGLYLLIGSGEASEKRLEYAGEREVIQVFDADDNLVLEYTIEEFNEWTEENWGIFDEPPQVGGREVKPGNFGWFDRSAAMSPQYDKFVFSVSDYAAASYASFVGIMDAKSGELDMVREYSSGAISSIIWSPRGNHLAYILATGRAQGDYLVVDNVDNLEREFMLSGKDLLDFLGSKEDTASFMPNFRGLNWIENGRRIEFTSNGPDEGLINWVIDNNGKGLRELLIKERVFSQMGNLMINNPGMEEGKWYLSYEEPGSPGLSKQLKLDNLINCFGEEEICSSFLQKDNILTGSLVEVLGESENDTLDILEITFIKR